MKVFITKYALTQGIYEEEGILDDRGYFSTGRRFSEGQVGYHKGEFHTTLESAQQKAEVMRLAKIESLHKQIIKLQNLKF